MNPTDPTMMFRNSPTMNLSNNNVDASSNSRSGRMRRGNSRGFDQMTPLAPGFVPGDDDVLVGRGKKCLVHTGNLRFKQIVATKLSAYLQAECRVDKTAILMEVISQVRINSPRGGFVKQNPKTGQYFEVGDFLAKEKTAQAFRDALHEYYSSSNPSKKKRRVQSTSSSEKKPATRTHCFQEERNQDIHEPTGQTLVNAMHTNFVQKKSAQRQVKSEPSSPVRNDETDAYRTYTPPPSFARFVSVDPLPEPSMTLDHGTNTKRVAKRKSSVILGETLAFLSSALTETGLLPDADALNNDVGIADPFEPIPLSRYEQMVIPDLA